jgi:FAD/FMN-containing dehydrogenase
VLWVHFPDCEAAQTWVRQMAQRGYCAVIEFAPPERKAQLEMWPAPGPDFSLMQRLKDHFDPHRLLNRGRLYGRL